MKNKIINGSLIIMLLTIGSKVIALLRDALMASNLGVGIENATFTFSMRTTMLLVSVGYGLTMALIPIYSKIALESDQTKKNKFVNNTINFATLSALAIAIVGIVLAGPLVRLLSSDIASNPETFKEAVILLRIMIMSIVFVAPQSVIVGVLQCHRKIIPPASMALASNLVYLIYQLIFLKTYGILGYGFAVVIGFIVMLAINIPTYKSLGFKYEFYLNVHDENLRKIGKSIVPIVISSSLVQINLYILTGIAGGISHSSIVILDYSNKMTMMFYEVFAIAINMITYPLLSSLKAENQMEKYNSALIKAVKYILIILLPVSAGILVLRTPIMAAYLMRGAFTFEEVERTASLLMLMIPTIIILSIKDILLRAFFSLDKNRIVLTNSIITTVLIFLITSGLTLFMGENSLAIGYTLTGIITTVMLYIPLKKEIGLKIERKELIDIFKIILSTIIMIIPVALIYNIFMSSAELNTKTSIESVLICGVIGMVIYFISLLILKVEDVNELVGMIRKKR